MSGVLNLCDVLQLIINRFYQSTLSQQDFISYAHQGVLHVALHFGYQLYAVREEILEQGLSYIPLIRTEFALDIL
jgi:4-hydroxyphenylpyruvate dioxygenase-like putative hemolysin